MAKRKRGAGAEDPAADLIDRVELGEAEEAEEGACPPAEGCVPADSGRDVRDEPKIHDPGWTAYVLSRLTDEEKVNDKPRVAGLRRVGMELLGVVLENSSEVVKAAEPNDRWVTVRATLKILWTKDCDHAVVRTFTGLADAHDGSLDNFLKPFPTANAETRAEGRAWRKALNVAVVAAEEISLSSACPDRVDATLKNMIDMKCKQLDINLVALLQAGKEKFSSPREMAYDKGQEVLDYLNDIQRGQRKRPANLTGYDASWEGEK